MASIKFKLSTIILFVIFSDIAKGKLSENKTNYANVAESKPLPKFQQNADGASLLFADELKVTLEKYLFGICPPTFKSRWSQMLNKNKTSSHQVSCDLDLEHQDLAGRLATLSLRAHTASRGECSRLSAALAGTFGDLARTAAIKQQDFAANEANKKQRKMSKAQKLKIAANQRKALAVKKKAAAVAAAAAAKVAAST